MTTIARAVLLVAAGVLFGVAVCSVIFLNPAGWIWVEHFLGRSHLASDSKTEAGHDPRRPSTSPDPAGKEGPERRVLYWRAPMDRSYIRDQPEVSSR